MIGKKMDKDPLLESDVIVRNKIYTDEDVKLQEYLKENNARLCYSGNFEDRSYFNDKLNCRKEIHHVGNATLGAMLYKNTRTEENKIIVTVVGDEKVREDIKNIFSKDNS